MASCDFRTTSSKATQAVACRLAQRLQAGDVLALEGDLGAGKTTFTQGLAQGLGVVRTVNSPTFTLIKEYKGRLPLYHMDVYRLQSGEEDLGYDEYFEGEGVTVVEWPAHIADRLPAERLDIRIKRISENERDITFHPAGSRYFSLCEELNDENFGD